MYTFMYMQISEISDIVDEGSLISWFDDVLVPAIKKFQCSVTTSNLGNYLVAYARASSISEVYYAILFCRSTLMVYNYIDSESDQP